MYTTSKGAAVQKFLRIRIICFDLIFFTESFSPFRIARVDCAYFGRFRISKSIHNSLADPSCAHHSPSCILSHCLLLSSVPNHHFYRRSETCDCMFRSPENKRLLFLLLRLYFMVIVVDAGHTIEKTKAVKSPFF